MKNLSFVLCMLVIAFGIAPACKKKGGTSGTSEANLVVETSPANGSTNLNVLGPDFPLNIEIKSAMPAKGVKIEVTAKKDGSADPAFFTTSNTSTAQQNKYTITQTPAIGVVCKVSITITSLSTASNVWVGSYTYSKK